VGEQRTEVYGAGTIERERAITGKTEGREGREAAYSRYTRVMNG
jgi:hypothetical protein